MSRYIFPIINRDGSTQINKKILILWRIGATEKKLKFQEEICLKSLGKRSPFKISTIPVVLQVTVIIECWVPQLIIAISEPRRQIGTMYGQSCQ